MAGRAQAAPITVLVSPSTASVVISSTQSFSAVLTNDVLSQGVTWSLSGAGCSGSSCGTLSGAARTDSTIFPATENPISQGGIWLNGNKNGLDWNDVATTPGFAHGYQPATPNPAYQYNDATAVLTGAWLKNQSVTETISCGPACQSNNSYYNEVELRLNTTITPHSISGYEVTCAMRLGVGTFIVRWNGPVNNFTGLASQSSVLCKDGDVHSAKIVNGVITEYLNGTPVLTATDNTYTGGAPGFGFDDCNPMGSSQDTCNNVYSTYGISSYRAAEIPSANSVTYKAPASVPSPATVTLTATSVADPSKTAPAIITVSTSSSPSPCDLNRDGVVNVADVQLEVNAALGVTACTAANDINKDGICNVVDVQRVVNAALGGQCTTNP